LIWGIGEAKYFFKSDWTASISLIRFNNSSGSRNAKARPIAANCCEHDERQIIGREFVVTYRDRCNVR
jgi:hypothetical protein